MGATFTAHTTANLAKIGRKTIRCQQRIYNAYITHIIYIIYISAIICTNNVSVLAHTQRKSKPMDQHAQLRLPSHLWILFVMLLISISPKSCDGACTKTYLALALALVLILAPFA